MILINLFISVANIEDNEKQKAAGKTSLLDMFKYVCNKKQEAISHQRKIMSVSQFFCFSTYRVILLDRFNLIIFLRYVCLAVLFDHFYKIQ